LATQHCVLAAAILALSHQHLRLHECPVAVCATSGASASGSVLVASWHLLTGIVLAVCSIRKVHYSMAGAVALAAGAHAVSCLAAADFCTQVRVAFFSEDRFDKQQLAPQAGEFGDS